MAGSDQPKEESHPLLGEIIRRQRELNELSMRQFAENERRREVEEREREIFRKHRRQLAQQTRVLIRDQARP